jgi:PAS domain S-box-containing protein
MGEMGKTKEQLTQELAQSRKRIAELEAAATASGKISSLYYGIFENFIEAATDSFSMWDSKLNLVYINNATMKYHPLGAKKSDVIGKNIKQLIPHAEKSGRYEKYKHVLETGEPLLIEDFKADPKYGDTYLSIKVFKINDGIGIISSDITERKRMEQTVQYSQQRSSALIDNAPDVIFTYDMNGRFLSGNKKAEELMGYSKEAMLGKTFAESGLFTPESLAKVEQRLKDYKLGKSTEPTPYELIARDGSHIFVEVRGVPVVQGDTMEVIAIARDITKRRMAEESLRNSEEKLRAIFESIGDSVTVINGDGNIIEVNDASVKLFGHDSKEEVLGMNALTFIAYDDQPSAVEKLIEAKPTRFVQYKYKRKDGSIFWGETSSDVLCDRSGNITGFIGIVRDVTERKKTEEALRQSEERLRTYFENAPDAIFVYDFNGVFLDGNRMGEEITGYSKDELVGKNFIESGLFSEEYALKAMNAVLKDARGEVTGPEEYEIIRKDGQKRYLESTSFITSSQWKGEVIGIARDITERKRIEKELSDYKENLEKMVAERTIELEKTYEELRESEERLRGFFENVPDILFAHNMIGQFTDINKKALEISGYSREEIVGRNVLETGFLPADQIEGVAAGIKGIEEGKSGYPYEVQLMKKNGDRITVEAVSFPIKRKGVLEVMGIARDITERKRIEAALKESEEKYRSLVEQLNQGIIIIQDNRIVLANNAMTQINGYNINEMLAMSPQQVINIGHPENRNQLAKRIDERTQGKLIPEHSEWPIIRKDGTERWLEVLATNIIFNGKPAIQATLLDITERKQMENALKNSEEKLRIMFSSMADGVVVIDINARVKDTNEAMLRMLEYDNKEDMIGRYGFISFVSDKERDSALKNMALLLKDRIPETQTFKLRSQKGREFIAEVHTSLLYDASGNPTDIMCVVSDITERKRMEEALKNSEEKLRTMFTSMADGVVVTDLEGKFKDANTALLRMFGYSSKEDIRDVNGFDFIAEKDRDLAMNDLTQLFNEGLVTGRSWTFKHSSGREFQAELSTALLKDAKGNPTDILVVMRDITERKRMDKALKDSEAKLRAIYDSIGDGISVTDLKGTLLDQNAAGVHLSGYSSKEEIVGLNGLSFIAETDRDRARNDMFNVLQKGIGITTEYKLVNKNGKEYDAEVSGAIIKDSENNPVAIVNVIRDISERKHIEEALRESEQKLRLMFEAIQEGIFVIDLNGKVAEVNRGVEKITGYKREKVLGQSGLDYMFPVFKDDAMGMLQKVIAQGGTQKEVVVPMKTAAGKIIEVEANSSVLRDISDNPIGLIGVVRDISERKKAEVKLKESKEELRFYLHQITKAQEEERKRIARELHDDTIQELITLSRQLDDLIDKKMKPDEDRRGSRKRIEEAQQKVTSILKGVRRFTRDLRPSILDDLGLVPALEWLTSDISTRFGIPINVSVIGAEKNIAPDAALAMFRVAQESLSNAGHHAKASQVQVNLKYSSKTVILSIIDDGIGFTPPKQISTLTRNGKLGIAGMYERAQLIDATLSIKSKRNAGTTITLEVPIKHTC